MKLSYDSSRGVADDALKELERLGVDINNLPTVGASVSHHYPDVRIGKQPAGTDNHSEDPCYNLTFRKSVPSNLRFLEGKTFRTCGATCHFHLIAEPHAVRVGGLEPQAKEILSLVPPKKPYPDIQIPKAFKISKDFGNIEPKGGLSTYAWAVEVMTGYRPTPIQAHTLLTNLHPQMQDPDFEIETSARKRIYLDLVNYTRGEPSKTVGQKSGGSMQNIARDNDAMEKIAQKSAMLDPTPENIDRMKRHAAAAELHSYTDLVSDQEVLDYLGVTASQVTGNAIAIIDRFYPGLSDKKKASILKAIGENSYPNPNKTQQAFAHGTLIPPKAKEMEF